MAVDDVYRWQGHAIQNNNIYMNTLAFKCLTTGDPSSAVQQTLADEIMNLSRPSQTNAVSWQQWNLTQLWGTNMTIDAPNCRRLNGKTFAGVFTAPVSGADTGTDPLPPQCACVVTLLTGVVGRRKRGRIYQFGMTEGSQLGGTWNTAMTGPLNTRLTTFLNKYKLGGTSTDLQWGVWSERTASGCIPNPSGDGHVAVDTPHPEQAFTPIIGYTIRTTVFTQRRRTFGVGR